MKPWCMCASSGVLGWCLMARRRIELSLLESHQETDVCIISSKVCGSFRPYANLQKRMPLSVVIRRLCKLVAPVKASGPQTSSTRAEMSSTSESVAQFCQGYSEERYRRCGALTGTVGKRDAQWLPRRNCH